MANKKRAKSTKSTKSTKSAKSTKSTKSTKSNKNVKSQSQRRIFGIVLLLALVAVAALALANGNSGQIAARGGSGQPTTYPATVWCEECAANGTEVPVWAGPDLDYGGEQVGSLAHNARVNVIDRNGSATLVQADGVYGWVESTFIQR